MFMIVSQYAEHKTSYLRFDPDACVDYYFGDNGDVFESKEEAEAMKERFVDWFVKRLDYGIAEKREIVFALKVRVAEFREWF